MRCAKLSLAIDGWCLSMVLALMLFQWMMFAVSFVDTMPGPLSITSNKSNQVLNLSYRSHHRSVGGNVNVLGAAEGTAWYAAWWFWVPMSLLLVGIPLVIIYCCCCGGSDEGGGDDAKEEKAKTGKDDKAKTGKDDKAKTGKEDKAKTGKEAKTNKEAKGKTAKDEKAKTNKEAKPPAGKDKAKTNK